MGGDGWTSTSDGGWAEKSVGHWAGMVGDGWNGPAIVAETGRRLGQTGGGVIFWAKQLEMALRN